MFLYEEMQNTNGKNVFRSMHACIVDNLPADFAHSQAYLIYFCYRK